MEKIKKFLKIYNGYGDGSGYGYGDGYGDGSGYGYGDGYGDGSGYGSGYGSGDGSGYDDGSGYGSGYGYDDGSGYGSDDGYGYGDGIVSYCGLKSVVIDDVQTFVTNVCGNLAKGFTLNPDLTKSPCYVAKYNGYFAHGETAQEAFSAAEEKYFDNQDTEEKISTFVAGHEYDTEYANADFFKWHHILTGSCEFGRNQFCKNNNIDKENGKMTTKRFLELTESSYGRKIIRQVKDQYES